MFRVSPTPMNTLLLFFLSLNPAFALDTKTSLCEMYLSRGHEMIRDIAAGPSEPDVYKTWPEQAAKLNRHTRRQAQSQMRREYPTLHKFSIDPRGQYLIAPKRAVDTLAALIDHPHPFFKKHGAKNPRRVFEQYISRQQRRTIPAAHGYGLYSGNDMLRAFEGAQDELRKYEAAHPGVRASIFMAGSFPNGRAHYNKSDIDAIVMPKDPALIHALYVRISSELSRRAKFNLEISDFAEMEKGHLAWNSQVSPLNFLVTTDRIELWIFPVLPVNPSELFMKGTDFKPDIYLL